jgi:hypothetical protein
MAEVLWYWQHDGEVCGPVGWRALVELAEQGELLPGDLVRRAGGAVWVAAREAQKAYAAELAAARAAAAQAPAPRPISAAPSNAGYTGGGRHGLANADAIDLNTLLEPSERIFDADPNREASQRDLYRASDPLSLVLTEDAAEAPRAPAPRPAPVQQPARPRPRPVAENPGPSGAEIAAILRQREAVSYGSTALVSVACVLMGLACMVVGLGFGVPFGLVGMLLAARALQGMYSSGNPRGRGVALAAMIAGLAEAIYFSRTVILQLAQALNLL